MSKHLDAIIRAKYRDFKRWIFDRQLSIRRRVRRKRDQWKTYVKGLVEARVNNLALVKELREKLGVAERQKQNLAHENSELRKRIVPIAEALAKVRVEIDESRGCSGMFRIMVDIDRGAVERSMIWGNDRQIINYIGEDIGRRAALAIFQGNIFRANPNLPPEIRHRHDFYDYRRL